MLIDYQADDVAQALPESHAHRAQLAVFGLPHHIDGRFDLFQG